MEDTVKNVRRLLNVHEMKHLKMKRELEKKEKLIKRYQDLLKRLVKGAA